MSNSQTMKRYIIMSIILACVLIAPKEAQAETYGFAALTANSGIQDQLAAQLGVEVTQYMGGVLFDFYNNGLADYQVLTPFDSTITLVLFDDGNLLGPATVLDVETSFSSGVDFTELPSSGPGSSPTLPGGNPIGFATTAGFGASADSPAPTWGVDEWNSGEDVEHVGIAFAFQPGSDFDDLLAAINLGFTDPLNEDALRIGLHVQSIYNDDPYVYDESEGFIMTPIPASVIIGLLGMGVAGIKLRKFA